jgi:hypothetical protein
MSETIETIAVNGKEYKTNFGNLSTLFFKGIYDICTETSDLLDALTIYDYNVLSTLVYFEDEFGTGEWEGTMEEIVDKYMENGVFSAMLDKLNEEHTYFGNLYYSVRESIVDYFNPLAIEVRKFNKTIEDFSKALSKDIITDKDIKEQKKNMKAVSKQIEQFENLIAPTQEKVLEEK